MDNYRLASKIVNSVLANLLSQGRMMEKWDSINEDSRTEIIEFLVDTVESILESNT